MRPPVWRPPVEPSPAEQTVMRLVRRAKLFVWLRQRRHELFDDGFQAELARTYQESPKGQPPVPPAQLALATILQAYTGASVERKTLADLAGSLVDGSMAYVLAELASLPQAAVVVEDRYSGLFKLEHVNGGWVAELLAAVQVRYPAVLIVFAETRPLAEEWAFRFLGAALAYRQAVRETGQDPSG